LGTVWLYLFLKPYHGSNMRNMLLNSLKWCATAESASNGDIKRHKLNPLEHRTLHRTLQLERLLLLTTTSRYVSPWVATKTIWLSGFSPLVFPITTTTMLVLLYYLNAHDIWRLKLQTFTKELWNIIIIIIIIIIIHSSRCFQK
jgi:hypothetical protein